MQYTAQHAKIVVIAEAFRVSITVRTRDACRNGDNAPVAAKQYPIGHHTVARIKGKEFKIKVPIGVLWGKEFNIEKVKDKALASILS